MQMLRDILEVQYILGGVGGKPNDNNNNNNNNNNN
jgi:hypothetical protein